MNDFHYELIAEDTETGARAGVLHTPHGKIETPIFMPVGTQATVKTLDQHDLIEAQAQIILGNAYHLYLRPGHELIDRMGGLHQFMNWSRPILTDSGGFQVFSLGDLNKISEEGVRFQSHLDGSSHLFTPESVMEIEHGLGADIIMAFDECTPYPCERDYAEKSMRMTLRWAERCIKRHQELSAQRTHRPPQALFGIVQGSVYPDLRRTCAQELIQMDLPGYAIGGLAVGEPRDSMFDVIRETTPLLPNDKPRYLMGVGLPNDLVEAVGAGADMFDCVVPTRNARNGTVFTRNGRLRLRNAAHAEDPQPLESDCACKTCTHYSRAYLRHLFKTNEVLGMHLATFHNVFFFQQLMRDMRDAIISGHFAAWQADFFALYQDS
ncbi:MAG: tRNA guanosine(34) transglycosylase Tgt [Gemmatimonadetes bacterium]|jgi:queuine tRNA-ribosyltransferase|nr:tRNA guanosine(34) transglycosylase Tgt [Gemmatimonadota bacterium]MBT5325068.1 tRNA guanosine(34) transglycosylase Tgt [Gemmatimonadota bacterium]MBT5452063.1 tRNA guanosine(34) transglycosylase Tgt [Gemmatimonadota bacterium]MBT6620410.1 tRNA guanosine(34) transglycosylase Tgt [Gemmatimonadota bacterium]MBT6905926.1 tRNA guanosine(34) transglycosylase Tgt [Gemmatimonadota bacterium]